MTIGGEKATNVTGINAGFSMDRFVGQHVTIVYHDMKQLKCRIVSVADNGLVVTGIEGATFTGLANLSLQATAFIPYANILTVYAEQLQQVA